MSRRKTTRTPRVSVPIARLDAIVERTRTEPLPAHDHATLKAAVDTLARLTEELETTTTTLERLRCGLCGAVFTAEPPAGVGTAKYDESAAAMIGLLKYGCGLPFQRIQRLEQALAIPLPTTTQWDVVAAVAPHLAPAVEELAQQAAQGTVLDNDDTTMRILKFTAEARAEALPPGAKAERTGVFTWKNSLFYRTLNGAKVGDLFMTLIHTAELQKIEPFDYLVALLRHAAAVALDPPAWMPWNYTTALARLAAEPAPD